MPEKNFKEELFSTIKGNVRQYSMFIALLMLMVIFTIFTRNNVFITPGNLSNLLLQAATVAVMTCGVVLVIVAGHIDLSIGSVVAFTGVIAATLLNKGFGTLPTILITLLIGVLIGLWYGYWVAYQVIPSFIVTLAGSMMFRGGVLLVSGGASVPTTRFTAFNDLSGGYVPTFAPDLGINLVAVIIGIVAIGLYNYAELKKRAERKKYGFEIATKQIQVLKMILISTGIALFFGVLAINMGIPYAVVILFVVAGIFTFISYKTKFGRYVYAIGGNKEAAKLSGINIKFVNLMIFVCMGTLTALGGILYTARLATATAAAGQGLELEVIAAAIIGGTSTLGGEGTIIGAVIGALVMTTLNNGLDLMGAPWSSSEWKYIIKGLILLAAVWFDLSSRRNKK